MEKTPPHHSGMTALPAPKVSGCGFYFEAGYDWKHMLHHTTFSTTCLMHQTDI